MTAYPTQAQIHNAWKVDGAKRLDVTIPASFDTRNGDLLIEYAGCVIRIRPDGSTVGSS